MQKHLLLAVYGARLLPKTGAARNGSDYAG
jgi:hypothetical protein